ncbi:MAG: hypothetical protein DRN17_02765 [Thermoplasmata archaeon]|nr:MAG: hypothetical protein DRN17_02765 [Thermoplasmata archaeon]
MLRKVIACLSLLILVSFLPQIVHSDERQFWAICIDNNASEGHEFGRYVMQSLISGGWDDEHIKLIEENSSRAFFNAIDWFTARADKGDIIFFYFSGHGYDGGIITGENKISYGEFNEELNKIKCRGMLVVIDACHSGSAIPLLQKEGRVIITSCYGNETSGYFSEPFVNALGVAADCNGNLDCSVTAEEIFSYIVSDWNAGGYTPQMEDGYAGNLSLLSAHIGGKKVDICQVHAQHAVDNLGKEKCLRQSFIAASNSILGISLKIAKWKNASDLVVEIYDSNSSFVGNAIIHAREAHDISNISSWVGVNTNIDVTPGEKYFMVCRSNSTWWWWGSGGWYGGGRAYVSHDDGSSWQAEGKISDFGFIIYGREDKIPPEVSILYPRNGEHLSGILPIAWIASDNDDKNMNGSIKIFCKAGNQWDMIAEGIENNGEYEWNSTCIRDGSYGLKVSAVDSSGNTGDDIIDIIVDNKPPETSCDLYGKMGRHSWYVDNATVVLSSYDVLTDMSNISVYYRIDGGVWKLYDKPLVIRSDGKHNFSYYGIDEEGNEEEERKTVIKIDCTPPGISFIAPEEKYLYVGERKIMPLMRNTVVVGRMKVKIRAYDNISFVSQVKFFMDGEEKIVDKELPYEWDLPFSFFRHEIKCVAYDNAGNCAEAVQTIFSFTF